MTSDEMAVAFAGLSASLHTVRIMANRGLVSPAEVETICSAILETLESLGSPQLVASMTARCDPTFADLRRAAAERWIGGPVNPA